jgi:hypothetical protein
MTDRIGEDPIRQAGNVNAFKTNRIIGMHSQERELSVD